MDLFNIFYMVPIIVFSVVVHECAHGWMAEKFGDNTARALGRITLNPIPHIDPMMTVVMPLVMFLLSRGTMMFAAAKPVPVNPYNLGDPKRDMIWVSLAGAGSNFALALGCALAFRLLGPVSQVTIFAGIRVFCSFGVMINLLLGVFNLIPIPPLDGSKVLMGLLPYEQAAALARLEPFGMFIILGLFAFGTLRWIVGGVVIPLMRLLLF